MADRKRKLLLADDSVTIQKVVNLTFADEGIEVATVGDGDAAMEKFVEFAPDLVMVDVNMPGTDGYRICEMIKQDEETARVPVILLVGSFEPFDEEEAYRVGADAYLTKPFQSIRQLVGKVTALLDADRSDSVAAGAQSPAKENAQRIASANDYENQADANFDSGENVGSVAAPPQFKNAETDDETIQTNQIGSLPADEAQRFSADFSVDEETVSPISVGEPIENSYSYETVEEDWTDARAFGAEDAGEEARAASSEAAAPPEDENAYNFAGESDASENESSNENADAEENSDDGETVSAAAFSASTPENFSWDFDEMNLLELPFYGAPPVEETAQSGERESEPETASSEAAAPIQATSPPSQTPAANVSPDVIEQIAARVAEKLSDRVMGAIRRELVPQMSDLINEELARKEESEK